MMKMLSRDRRLSVESRKAEQMLAEIKEKGFDDSNFHSHGIVRAHVGQMHTFCKGLEHGNIEIRVFAGENDDRKLGEYYRTRDVKVFSAIEIETEYSTDASAPLELLLTAYQNKEHRIDTTYHAILDSNPDIGHILRGAEMLDAALHDLAIDSELKEGTDAREIAAGVEEALMAIPEGNSLLEQASHEFEPGIDQFRALVRVSLEKIKRNRHVMSAMAFVMDAFDMSEEDTQRESITAQKDGPEK